MRRLILFSVWVVLSERGNADEPAVTPAMELAKIKREVSEARGELAKKLRAKEDETEARKAFTDLVMPHYQHAWRLAENNAKDPAALQALEWILRGPLGYTDATRPVIEKTYALLIERHATDAKLVGVCSIAPRFDNNTVAPEQFLRLVIAKNRFQNVQGVACLRLASVMHFNAEWARQLRDPATGKALELRLRPEMARYYQSIDPGKCEQEAQELLDRTIKDFGESKVLDNRTLADMAREKREDWRKPKTPPSDEPKPTPTEQVAKLKDIDTLLSERD